MKHHLKYHFNKVKTSGKDAWSSHKGLNNNFIHSLLIETVRNNGLLDVYNTMHNSYEDLKLFAAQKIRDISQQFQMDFFERFLLILIGSVKLNNLMLGSDPLLCGNQECGVNFFENQIHEPTTKQQTQNYTIQKVGDTGLVNDNLNNVSHKHISFFDFLVMFVLLVGILKIISFIIDTVSFVRDEFNW